MLTMDSSLISTLNQRSALRRNILRAGLMEQAEAERRKALEEMKTAPPNLPEGEEKGAPLNLPEGETFGL
jgi:hypothetical protein